MNGHDEINTVPATLPWGLNKRGLNKRELKKMGVDKKK